MRTRARAWRQEGTGFERRCFSFARLCVCKLHHSPLPHSFSIIPHMHACTHTHIHTHSLRHHPSLSFTISALPVGHCMPKHAPLCPVLQAHHQRVWGPSPACEQPNAVKTCTDTQTERRTDRWKCVCVCLSERGREKEGTETAAVPQTHAQTHTRTHAHTMRLSASVW